MGDKTQLDRIIELEDAAKKLIAATLDIKKRVIELEAKYKGITVSGGRHKPFTIKG